jgi:hypothetical protein
LSVAGICRSWSKDGLQETLLHQRYRHSALAQGKPVLYAGDANFNNGKLEWWSNGSGNYRPDADHAAQSGLPMNQFYA